MGVIMLEENVVGHSGKRSTTVRWRSSTGKVHHFEAILEPQISTPRPNVWEIAVTGASGGSIDLTVGIALGDLPGTFDYNAAASTVEAYFQGFLDVVGVPATVTCGGGPLNTSAVTLRLDDLGTPTDVSVDDGDLTGGGTADVEETQTFVGIIATPALRAWRKEVFDDSGSSQLTLVPLNGHTAAERTGLKGLNGVATVEFRR